MAKKKRSFLPLYLIGTLIIGIGIGFAGGFFIRPVTIGPDNAQGQQQIKPEPKDITLEKDGFSVLVPAGWHEGPNFQGVSAVVINLTENITDQTLQKINFRTNYAVSYDTLSGRTEEEYVNYIRESITKLLPSAKLGTEKTDKINGNNAYIIEGDINNQGANLKVMVILIKGKNEDIWTLAFNTSAANYEVYKELFARIAKSFTLK